VCGSVEYGLGRVELWTLYILFLLSLCLSVSLSLCLSVSLSLCLSLKVTNYCT